MKMHKILTFLFSLTLFAALLLTVVACGDDETTPSDPGTSAPESDVPTVTTENPFAEANPWDESLAIPQASLAETVNPGEQRFSGLEWTGQTNSKNASGQTVHQSNIVSIGELSAHSSSTVVYKTLWEAYTGARAFAPETSSYYRLLTGSDNPWMLAVYKNEAEAKKAGVFDEFFKVGYDMNNAPKYQGNGQVSTYRKAYYGGFKQVTLPASWQTQGFDFPIYSNTQYPWDNDAYGNGAFKVPVAPSVFNPVGLYRTSVAVDADWLSAGRRVILSFGGVESAFYLYVNGYEVGYSEDSFDISEFDITPYLNKDGKENLIALKVYRWCDGSYFENQDFLRLGGIFRDVALYSVPGVSIADYTVVTDLDSKFTDATLQLSVKVNNATTAAYEEGFFSLDVRLIDAAGHSLFAGDPLRKEAPALASGTTASLTLSREVTAPHLWSDEDPYLYTLILSLYDKNGVYYGSIAQELGFREITFTKTTSSTAENASYKQMLLNGKPLIFKGVDRHDNDPETGRYVSHELYEKDIQIMKSLNINAVRTSHYPNDRYFYDMCDKYGILVLAECNIETHYGVNASDTTRYFTTLVRDRVTSFTESAKNRTCIVMWSIGNETTMGAAIYPTVISELKRRDPTRPVHFESLGSGGGVDVASAMYSSIYDVQGRGNAANRMPFVLCEYAHAMGNSVGNLYEYWEVIRASDNLIGGFIWDFVDQSIWTPIPTASGWDYYGNKQYLAYGGSWNDSPNSGNFCQNGIVSADRTVQPEAAEVKYVYQSIWFDAQLLTATSRTVSVYNEYHFTDLSAFTFRYEVLSDGQVTDSGSFTLAGAPGATVSVEVPYRLPETTDGREFFLTLTAFDKAGGEESEPVASEQFALYLPIREVKPATGTGSLSTQENDTTLTVTGADFTVVFDKTTGRIASYTKDGETILTSGPEPSFNRAHTDNDKNALSWDNVTARGIEDFSVSTAKDGASLTVTGRLVLSAAGAGIDVAYTVYAGGALTVNWVLRPNATLGEMYRFAGVMTLPGDYESILFYGNGPADTYCDRLRGSHVGLWSTTVSDSFFPYPKPQDTGNKTGVRWFSLTSAEKKTGLLLAAEGEIEVSALHFSYAQLRSARYPYLLKATNAATYLTASYGSRGTGGASCGPDTLSQYRLYNDGRDYSLTYTLIPFDKTEADPGTLARGWHKAPSYTAADIDALAAQAVDNQIAALLADPAGLKEARAAYDALTAAQKALVKNLALLESLEQGSRLSLTIPDLSAQKNTVKPTEGTLWRADTTSPTGYALRGSFTVADKGGKINSTLCSSAFTLGALVKLDDLDANNIIFAKGDTQVAIKTNGSGQLEFFIYQNGNWNAAVITDASTYGVRPGVWFYIAGVREAGTLKFYLNGKLAATKAVSGGASSSSNLFGVGADPSSSRYLRGEVAMAHLLPFAASADTIAKASAALLAGNDALPFAASDALFWFDASECRYE